MSNPRAGPGQTHSSPPAEGLPGPQEGKVSNGECRRPRSPDLEGHSRAEAQAKVMELPGSQGQVGRLLPGNLYKFFILKTSGQEHENTHDPRSTTNNPLPAPCSRASDNPAPSNPCRAGGEEEDLTRPQPSCTHTPPTHLCTYTHTCTHTCTKTTHACVHAHLCKCLHTFDTILDTYLHPCLHTHLCTHPCTYTCMHTHLYGLLHTPVHTHMHAYTPVCTPAHTVTHTPVLRTQTQARVHLKPERERGPCLTPQGGG